MSRETLETPEIDLIHTIGLNRAKATGTTMLSEVIEYLSRQVSVFKLGNKPTSFAFDSCGFCLLSKSGAAEASRGC